MAEHSGTPISWHTKWFHECKLGSGHASVVAHESACRTLHVLVCFDQIDASNSAAAEIIARQIQLIEEKHRDLGNKTGEASVSFDAHLYMGTSTARGGLCVSPDLQEWIAEELKKESAVLKERRKAREERNVGGPRGGNKDA